MNPTRRSLIAAACGMALAPLASSKDAPFPARPVRLIIPAAPGGSADKNARAIADKLSELWKHPVIVEYKAGAHTVIGSDFVAKSPPDGHTLLVNSAAIAVNPALYKKLPYDTLQDLVPVTLISTAPFALVVHPSVPAKDAREFVALARSKPHELSFGTAESRALLAGLQFNHAAGTRLESVPFKGAGALMNDLVAGHVPVAFSALSSVHAQVQAGRLRLLGIATAKPSPLAPQAAPLAADVPGFEAESWFGMFAPKGTPTTLAQRIQRDVAMVLRDKDVARRFEEMGAQPIGEAADVFAARMRADVETAVRVARDAQIKPE